MEKQLWILRHATAEYAGLAGADFNRSLTTKGQDEAQQVGGWLADKNIVFDSIIASSAMRTVQTARSVAQVVGYEQEIIVDRNIYEASLDALVKAVMEIPEAVDIALFIGHNPGLESLVAMSSPSHAAQQVYLRPASLVHVSFPQSWDEILGSLGQFRGVHHVDD